MNAARILGAGFWHQLRYLVLPMMKAVILIAIIIRSIEVFKLFDAAYILTKGGPGEASTNISLFLYDETAENTRWGYASSVAIIVMIMVSIVGFYAIRPIERAQDETLRGAHRRRRGRPDTTTRRAASRTPSRRRRGSDGRRRDPRPRPRRLRQAAERGAGPVQVASCASGPSWSWRPSSRSRCTGSIDDVGQAAGRVEPARAGRSTGRPRTRRSTTTRTSSASPRRRRRSSRPSATRTPSSPLKNSIVTATLGTVLAMVVGVFAAYGIARFRAGGRDAAVPDPAAADVPTDRDPHRRCCSCTCRSASGTPGSA